MGGWDPSVAVAIRASPVMRNTAGAGYLQAFCEKTY
jgi:hypothetical protein